MFLLGQWDVKMCQGQRNHELIWISSLRVKENPAGRTSLAIGQLEQIGSYFGEEGPYWLQVLVVSCWVRGQ
jgi:hypothetical protein